MNDRQVTPRFKGRQSVEKFDPTKTAVSVKGLEAIIKNAKRIRDWPKRDDAIEALIDEQQGFVAWWNAHVTPAGGGARHGVAKSGPHEISAEDAKAGTGIDKRQVSKWRERLKDIDAYRANLRKAAWRWAWSGTRGGRVISETGADVPPELRIGDFREVFADIEDGSVDLIFTDPPYDKKHVPLYEDLAALGARVLKPGGSLLAYCGHYAIPEICTLMLPHLRWHWLLATYHKGGQHVCLPGAGVKVLWKPILWLTNGSISQDRDIVVDCFETAPPDKSHDSWSQSLALAEYYIKSLTDPDALVVDPFAGCCTTLLACRELGRCALGAEIDANIARVAAKRLAGGENV